MMPAIDPETTDVGARVESFVTRCRERGLSVTPQRLTLYRALVSTTAHPTPEMLFADVREEMPTLSLATVYKAIETFKDLGVVQEIRVPDDHRMRLDANMDPHHHMVCTRCQVVVDVHTPIGTIELPESARQGFEITGHAVQFRGVCADCRAA